MEQEGVDMQEVFENIIEKLESEAKRWEDSGTEYKDKCEIAVGRGLRNAIEIVKQEAKQYNNGWIPVSEKLPEESLNSVIGWDEYRERSCFVQYIGGRFVLGDDTESVKITHWMYAPYQPKGE